jgi:RNA polymerase sigma-70 factor (ECF subfamily)
MTDVRGVVPATASFEVLLEPILELAYGVAYRLTKSSADAEDLVQEAALLAYKAFNQYQPGTNFKAWYLRILTNCFFAHYRKRKRAPHLVDLDDASPLHLYIQTAGAGLQGPPEDPAALVIGRLGEEQVAEAVASLPEEFRVVCTLYFMQEASYQEIAQALGCPVGTVRSRLHRGRRMLQKTLWAVAEEHGIVAAMVAGKAGG